MQLIFLTLAVFITVFGKSFQAQNVNAGHYRLAAATSVLLTFSNVFVVLETVASGWAVLPYVGVGGVSGVLFSMKAHRWVLRRERKKDRRGHTSWRGA